MSDKISHPTQFQFPLGPSSYFDMSEILDWDSLAIHISSDEIIDSRVRIEKQIRIIRLTFTSQVWHGYTWKHQARIYLPVNSDTYENVGIIGTSKAFMRPGNRYEFIPGTGLRSEEEFSEATAIDLNIPIMMFITPDEGMDDMNESDLMGLGMKNMLATGDLTWSGYYAIAKSYLRAITVMQALPDIQAKKAVLLGCSKRGLAVSICTGIGDERIEGVMITCFPGGNFLGMAANKYRAFGPEIGGPSENRTGPGFQPPKVQLRALNNPIGFGYLMAFDPYLWRDQIKVNYLVAIGTNDEFYGIEAATEMFEEFSGDSAFLAVDGVSHTWVSKKHLAAWRMWLQKNYMNETVPHVDIKLEQKSTMLRVTATVVHNSMPLNARLHFSYNSSHDWRKSEWYVKEMQQESDWYRCQLGIDPKKNLALYVEVEFGKADDPSYVSSLVKVVPKA